VRRAVIDVGSNSCLLTVAELQNGTWVSIADRSIVTALGQGTKSSGLLHPEGSAKTRDALRLLFEEARGHGVAHPLAFGTMALRIASDAESFLASCRKQGTPLGVLSGEEEARFGFLSVASDPLFAAANRLTIIDPGGHSTELVTADRTGDSWETRFERSYAVGALGLREHFLADETPDFPARMAAVEHIDRLIGLEYRPHQSGQVIVLGATGTNLITIRKQMPEWDAARVHGARLDYEEVGRAVGWLCDMTDAQRRNVIGMEPGRERTLHIGALILERFLYCLHALDCRVSVRGWRHAVLETGYGLAD